MRHATLLALSLVAATGCVSDEAIDGKDDVGCPTARPTARR